MRKNCSWRLNWSTAQPVMHGGSKLYFRSQFFPSLRSFFASLRETRICIPASISHRPAVLARVGAADQDAALEVDRGWPGSRRSRPARLDEPVPLGFEGAGGRRGRSPTRGATVPPPSAGWPVGSDEPKWRNRGASPASWTSMPKSIMLQITCTCPAPACRPPSGRSSARACRPW